MTIFNIFKRDAQNRGYRYRKGYKPRVSSHGLFGLNKKLDDPISWRANNMSEAYGLKSAELQGKALEERDAAMAKLSERHGEGTKVAIYPTEGHQRTEEQLKIR